MSIGLCDDSIYVFGGQDDDSNKLSDMWEYNMKTSVWTQMRFGWHDFKPMPRSGHTTMVCDGRLFIFGGIFELTKELNDLCLFDLKKKVFHPTRSIDYADPDNKADASPLKLEHTETATKSGLTRAMTHQRTTLGGASPTKRKTSPKKNTA